jgi:hypothetical protein
MLKNDYHLRKYNGQTGNGQHSWTQIPRPDAFPKPWILCQLLTAYLSHLLQMCFFLSHLINTQLNAAAVNLDTNNLYWICNNTLSHTSNVFMWNFYHIYIFIYVVYTAEPRYKGNVEGHNQDTCYKLFHTIQSVLRKYVTCKYYSFFKNFANMQYNIGVQTPGLSLYQLSIIMKHSPYDQWIPFWTTHWPINTKEIVTSVNITHLIQKHNARA